MNWCNCRGLHESSRMDSGAATTPGSIQARSGNSCLLSFGGEAPQRIDQSRRARRRTLRREMVGGVEELLRRINKPGPAGCRARPDPEFAGARPPGAGPIRRHAAAARLAWARRKTPPGFPCARRVRRIGAAPSKAPGWREGERDVAQVQVRIVLQVFARRVVAASSAPGVFADKTSKWQGRASGRADILSAGSRGIFASWFGPPDVSHTGRLEACPTFSGASSRMPCALVPPTPNELTPARRGVSPAFHSVRRPGDRGPDYPPPRRTHLGRSGTESRRNLLLHAWAIAGIGC